MSHGVSTGRLEDSCERKRSLYAARFYMEGKIREREMRKEKEKERRESERERGNGSTEKYVASITLNDLLM